MANIIAYVAGVQWFFPQPQISLSVFSEGSAQLTTTVFFDPTESKNQINTRMREKVQQAMKDTYGIEPGPGEFTLIFGELA